MKVLKRKCLSILAFIVLPLFILGCSPKKEKLPNVAEEITLNSGAVLKSEEGAYKLYNYDNGKYEQIKSNNIVLAYDKNSSSYIATKEGKPYVVSNGNKFNIKDIDYSDLKLSKDAGFISYFIEDNGLKLKIFDAALNKEIEMKSNVSISGTLYDWYDVNTLVYYGVSNDGVNGLFTYNIKENKEELLYKIKEGYLAFIKGTINNVVFVQLTLENNKKLLMIDKKTKDVKLLTDNIEELSDIIINNEKIYFTGKISNNVSSVYELKNNKAKRLVFDFPAIVKTEKGLTIDENGNILFVGSNNVNANEEQIYTYTQDGSISAVSKDSVDYVFLDYRS
ncbi:lipoprotein [Clostridium gelidum]|uniref:Lipoprotein n=1 Tax=Clostridium gelidum TaxID=704125 RepID=A0ABN6J0U5_9CLOT|nr:hypothetical protein [Clostridium gelidum]BCZ47000.1 lipoprotein [Clostridium gelidum]